MGLHLVTGRANTGKTGVLHEAVLTAARDGVSAVVLLPTFAEVQRTRAEFSEKLIIGVDVQTLDMWATRMWALHGDGRRPVEPAVRSALAANVARGATGPLLALSESRGLPVLLGQMAARTAGQKYPAGLGVADDALLKLVRTYFSVLEDQRLVEPAEVLVRLGVSGCVSGAVLVANRFTDLSPAQEALLGGLALSNEVHVALTYEEGHAPTDAMSPLVRRLRSISAEYTHLPNTDLTGELQAIEERLFQPLEPVRPEGLVTLVEAAGSEAEAAVIAGQAAELVQSGIEPNEIAVTFRDLSSRRSMLAAALSARGLDFNMDVAVPFVRTRYGAAIGALVALASGAGSREHLLSYLHGPYSGAPTEQVERFDQACRRERIVDPATILGRASEVSESVATAVRLARRVARDPVHDAVTQWQELVEALMSSRSRSETNSVDGALDAEAFNIVTAALRQMEGVTEPVGAGAFLSSLTGVVVSSGGAERPGAVYVTEAHRMRARRFRAVILGGLTAQEFSSEAREPLVASVLRRVGLPAGTDERLSERLLFYSVVTRARERLVLARQSSDSSGKPFRPSVFWDEVVDLYRTAEQARNDEPGRLATTVQLPLSRLAEAAPVFDRRRRQIRERVAASGKRGPTPQRGRLDAAAMPALARGEYSVTALETYIACPYRWFYDRVISPRVLDETFDERARGTLAHRLLSGFYRRFREEVALRVDGANLDAALELLESVIDETARGQRTRPQGMLEEVSAAAATEAVRAAVIQDAALWVGLEPVAHEWRFGCEADRRFSFAGIPLRGSIDRVDEGPDGLIVTDYKSSATVYGRKRFESEGLLQAVIYAEAAEKHLGKPALGSFYRSLATGEHRGYWRAEPLPAAIFPDDIVSADESAALRSWASETAQHAVQGIESGVIDPRPHAGACKWCGAAPMCPEVVR